MVSFVSKTIPDPPSTKKDIVCIPDDKNHVHSSVWQAICRF